MTSPAAADAQRVAEAVAGLAATVGDPHLRTQLHALAGVTRNLGLAPPADDAAVVQALDDGMAREDEPAVLQAARSLARARREAVAVTDWTEGVGVRTAEDVAGALQRFLAERGHRCEVAVPGRATVGLSQDTWFATLTGADGASEDVVVRLPTGASGHRAILTQRAALQAVASTAVPAPTVRWSDDTPDNPFEAPVIVMERLDGAVPAGWHEVATPRQNLLAQLGLGEDPILRAALWWLDRHLPATRPSAIVHHDLRMGNLVVDGDRLVGILDWELAAIGDPHTDLVWCFVAVWEPPGVDVASLYEAYADAAGVDLDEGVLHWESVMAYVRLAYYAASGAVAFSSGASSDLRLAALAHHLPVQLDRLTAVIAGDPIV